MDENKVFELEFYGELYEVALVAEKYSSNGTLAVEMMCIDGCPFARLTVNIEASNFSAGEDAQFIDTNNCPWAEEFLQKNGIASPTGIYGRSGFCSYPLYKFNMEKLEQFEEEGEE